MVLFSSFSTFFPDYQRRSPFYLIRQWPCLQLAAAGYPDPDTRNARHSKDSYATEDLAKETACDRAI